MPFLPDPVFLLASVELYIIIQKKFIYHLLLLPIKKHLLVIRNICVLFEVYILIFLNIIII